MAEFNVAQPEFHNINDMIDKKLRGGDTSTLQFPEDRPKYYTHLEFGTYSAIESGASSGSFTSSGDTIILPLPINLQDKHTVKWDEKPITGQLKSLYDYSLGVLGTPISAALGLAPNWFHTIMFDRPEFKRHELAFKLSPRNFRESESIRDIIIMLNNAMAPDTWLRGATILFRFPLIVQVTLKPNAGFLYKFKPAVVEHFIVNYAGGGNKAFYHGPDTDNPPESVEFTLHIIETEYWLGDQGQFNDSDNYK